MVKKSIKVPLARVWSKPEGGVLLRTLAWGDGVDYVGREGPSLTVDTISYDEQPDGSVVPNAVRGYIRHGGKTVGTILGPASHKVLKVDFVDVQQGDAAVVESPGGRVMLIDGGENQLFARYLANRFPGTTADAPLEIDTIVVSHGDADHFDGLPKILESEEERRLKKRIFIDPRRIFHNGLVKGPSDLREVEMFGQTATADGRTYAVDLVDDLDGLPDERLNRPFRGWRSVIDTYRERARARSQDVTVERLQRGSAGKFASFADEGIRIDVLGPAVEKVPTPAGPRPGLPYLRQPRPGPSSAPTTGGSLSASHTINGHSVVLRLTYGRCRFLFTGDLNEEAQESLLAAEGPGRSLEADVLKVPHHGSADYLPEFLRAVGALISVVSSGDESGQKEYIHPRATLVGGLGRHSRSHLPLIFVTELVAFFAVEGYVGEEWHTMTPSGEAAVRRDAPVVDVPTRQKFFGFSRSAFGTVHVRTDKKRLLVWTDSALDRMKEAYLLDLTAPQPVPVEVAPI